MDACMELEANEAFSYRPYHVGDASLPIVETCCSAARAALSGVLAVGGSFAWKPRHDGGERHRLQVGESTFHCR